MSTAQAAAVTRVDYAGGVYVTYEKMTPESDGYDAGQRWYYVVWSSDVADHSTGFEVEDCGYAETKAEAVAFARETRESLKLRRSAVASVVADADLTTEAGIDEAVVDVAIAIVKPEPRYYVYDRKVSPLTTYSAVNPRYWIVDRTTNLPVDECSTKRAATLAARYLNAADEVEASQQVEPGSTYAASLVKGRTEQTFGIVSGETALKMLASSTTPEALRFRKIAEVA